MFKKWAIFLFFFLGLMPQVSAYGHLVDLFMPNSQGKPEANKAYLSYKFMTQNQISFCTQGVDSSAFPFSDKKLSLYFQAAFWEWTRGTAHYLRRSGRAEEFADVIALLEKPFTLTDLGPCRQDMNGVPDIEITTEMPNVQSNSDAYYWQQNMRFGAESQIRFFSANFQNYKPQKPNKKAKVQGYIRGVLKGNFAHKGIKLARITRNVSGGPSRNQGYFDPLFTIMLHEVGHAFGLADEEPSARKKEFNVRAPQLLKMSDLIQHARQYVTPYHGDGLMSYSSFYRRRTADDVMGLITVFDRFSGKKRIIYPLLSDFARPEVGAVVNGRYVFPPIKKTKRARRLLMELFYAPNFSFWSLREFGDEVFVRKFSPVPGYEGYVSPAQKQVLSQVKKELTSHLQTEHK